MRSAILKFWFSHGRPFYYMALLAMVFSLVGIANPGPVYADQYTVSDPATSLTIKVGTATTDNPTTVYTEHKTFTESEMTERATYQQMYSYYDAMPTPILDAATGVLLSDLLAEAGIDIDQTEKFYFYTTDVEGRPFTTLTKDYLFGEPRYYYPNNYISWNPDTNKPDLYGEWGGPTDGKVEVYPMLAVSDNWLRALVYGVPDFDTQDSSTRFRLLNGQTESEYLNSVDGSKKAAKWVYEIDIKLKSKFTPPALTADSTDNTLGQAVDLTFTEDPAWQAAISGITVNGIALTKEQYVVGTGNIRIAAGIFPTAGEYSIIVTAPDYADALVTQTMHTSTGTYTVTIDGAITGGTVSADRASAAEGDLVVLTVTPEPGKKLMVNSLKYTANGTTVVVTGNSFAMPASDVQVTATFITTSNNPDAWDGSIDISWYNTTDTSFQISTPAQLVGLAAIVNGTADGIAQDYFEDKTVILKSDVDLGGVQNQDGTWDPAGAQWTAIGGGEPGEAGAAFNGTFDGGGHLISNLYIERQAVGWDSNAGKNQGLFGIINTKACVKNLGVTGYVAAYRSVGGVVGKNWGRVESCFNAATVIGMYNKGVGGIVGANWTQNSTPSIVNCYNIGSVLAKYEIGLAGGIAGDNEYLLANCYNAGPVSSISSPYVGGITGNIKNGSTDGSTNPIVQNCYYNSGLNDKGIGNIDTSTYTITNMEGKTAEEMKTEAFVALLNANNGNAFRQDTNNINSGYPILAWQAATTTDSPKYTVTPVSDESVYEVGATPDGIGTMTVKSEVTGLKYFAAQIAPVAAHAGKEAVVFVHLRVGYQFSLNVTKADFDLVGEARAGFNVEPGDVVEVYIVDELTNDVHSNPIILQ